MTHSRGRHAVSHPGNSGSSSELSPPSSLASLTLTLRTTYPVPGQQASLYLEFDIDGVTLIDKTDY